MKKMCPMENCKSNEGLCIHEKIMWVIVAIGIMAVVFFCFSYSR